MRKTLLYTLFRIGAIPRKLLPILQSEGIVVADEGIAGRLITKNVRGPCKRYLNRSEGFSGCLVITTKRVACFTYWKRQINVAVGDSRLSALFVRLPDDETLSLSFESSVFRDQWEGIIEFEFETENALQFRDALKSVGAREGSAADAASLLVGAR